MSETLTTPATNYSPWRFTVAPMLDWTDRHCRVFHRALSRHARLYTEMVTTGAILHGDQERLLGFNEVEHPVALQLGGSDPADLAASIRIAERFGYDEYNLNCGCPSDRVQKGSFGACLMLEPKTVARAVKAMQEATDKVVTVKHRIGVDDHSEYSFVRDFVGEVYNVGCHVFIVHTRSAWLKGLSPKENREIPPLNRDVAYQLKRDFQNATFVINGQIDSLPLAQELIDAGMDGVMVGRATYHNSWLLAGVDGVLFNDSSREISRKAVVDMMSEYLLTYCADNPMAVRAVARHMLGFMQGMPGARQWRRLLSDPATLKNEGTNVLQFAWKETFAEHMAED